MKKARDVREQLEGLLERVEIEKTSAGVENIPIRKVPAVAVGRGGVGGAGGGGGWAGLGVGRGLRCACCVRTKDTHGSLTAANDI